MPYINCKSCGKEIEVCPSETKGRHKRSYCDRKCYTADAKNFFKSISGENHYAYIKDDVPVFEIKDEITAYFLGFLQTDGTLDHKRVSIEIGTKDNNILYLFQKKFGGKITHRFRKTNFSDKHESSCWRLGSVAFVKQMNALGIPCGKSPKLFPQ